jgi:hypothetical protein
MPRELQDKLMRPSRERRLARYKELRDSGAHPVDAIRDPEIGLADHHAYERWYRKVTGQPDREPGVMGTGMKPGPHGWNL